MKSIPWLLVLAACGGGDDAAPADAPSCTPKAGQALMYGTSGGPNPGVTACLEGTEQCTQSAGAEAAFTLCVPDGEAFGVRASKPSYETALYLFPAATPNATVQIGDIPGVVGFWSPIGAEFPATTKGLLVGFVRGENGATLQGLTVSVPSAGTVYYGDPAQVPSTSLTQTTSSGSFMVGDVAPGDYDITVDLAGQTCQLDDPDNRLGLTKLGGFESATGNVRIPVVAGATTVVFLRCHH